MKNYLAIYTYCGKSLIFISGSVEVLAIIIWPVYKDQVSWNLIA